MKKISTGEPSTLKTYRNIALVLSLGNENSNAVKYFDKIIKVQGEDQEVIAHETQMLHFIATMVKAELDMNE